MDADHSCIELVNDLGLKITPSTSDAGMSDSMPSPRSNSPDPNCAICLGKLENKSFTDSCLHQFCFACLQEWSKVKAECPLCKQTFKSIIHNVRSIEDYDEYFLTTASSPVCNFQMPHPWQDTFGARPSFRYRTTAVSSYLDYVARLEEAMNDHILPTLPTQNARTHYSRRRQNGTSDFRRNIYQQGLWVQQLPDITGRVRESSPEFYRENPTMVHRLVPWLNRELNVLCSGNDTQAVLSSILDLITVVPIRSPGFTSEISRYLGRHTEHFVHEFHSFAITPYDLIGYDRHANYVSRSALAHLAIPEHGDTSDSDVQVVGSLRPSTPRPIQLASDSDDCVIVDGVFPRQSTPEVITIESEEEVVQVNININSDSACPGPSGRPPMRSRCLAKPKRLNVSININRAGPSHIHSRRSSTSSSSSSTSSSDSWMPQNKIPTSKRKKSKKRSEKSKNWKNSKSRIMKPKNKSLPMRRQSLKNNDIEQPSPRHVQQQPSSLEAPTLRFSSDEDNSVLRIDSDVNLSTSSDEEFKPSLRSVVLKTEIKTEPRNVSPQFGNDWDMPYSSDCSYRGPYRSARRYSSSSCSQTGRKSATRKKLKRDKTLKIEKH